MQALLINFSIPTGMTSIIVTHELACKHYPQFQQPFRGATNIAITQDKLTTTNSQFKTLRGSNISRITHESMCKHSHQF